jgi:hypothetical protein
MRTLTIVIHFDEENPPDWIWENHKNNSYQHGILISVIAEGDKICDRDNDEN